MAGPAVGEEHAGARGGLSRLGAVDASGGQQGVEEHGPHGQRNDVLHVSGKRGVERGVSK